jgi:hypothetical protein
LSVSTSAGNTAVGFVAGANITTGGFNTTIGCQAGSSLTTNTNCLALGYLADVSAGLTNSTAIGNHAVCSASNTIQLGNSSVTNVNTSGAITAPSITLGGATSMNHYDTVTGSLNFTGAGSVSVQYTVSVLNGMVTLYLYGLLAGNILSSAGGYLTSSSGTALASAYYSASNINYGSVIMTVGSVKTICLLTVLTDGTITIGYGIDNAVFPTGGELGFINNSVVYHT